MHRIVLLMIVVLTSSPAVALLKISIDDYFNRHPELNENTHVREQIILSARSIARLDIGIRKFGEDFDKAEAIVDRLMRYRGDVYAKKGIRSLVVACRNDVRSRYPFTEADCELLNRYDKK